MSVVAGQDHRAVGDDTVEILLRRQTPGKRVAIPAAAADDGFIGMGTRVFGNGREVAATVVGEFG